MHGHRGACLQSGHYGVTLIITTCNERDGEGMDSVCVRGDEERT